MKAKPAHEAPLDEAQIAEWEMIFPREKRIFDDPETAGKSRKRSVLC